MKHSSPTIKKTLKIFASILLLSCSVWSIPLNQILSLQPIEIKPEKDEMASDLEIAELYKENAFIKLRTGEAIPQPCILFSYYGETPGTYFFQRMIEEALIDTFYLDPQSEYEEKIEKLVVVYEINKSTMLLNTDIKAAVTSYGPIKTTGNLVIDGRDWEPEGFYVVDDGVYGIKTQALVNRYKRTVIGGNGNQPRFNAGPEIIDQEASFEKSSMTPEEVLGLPPDALKNYKTTELPTMPFYGIVYYTPEGEFTSPDFENSSGIFICHNSDFSASLKNFSGSFNGLLICDNINRLNTGAEILGAVVTLSQTKANNLTGGDNSSIRYSSQILTDLNNYVNIVSDTTINVVSCQRQ